MLGYQQYFRHPSVTPLQIHLEGARVLIMDDEERQIFNEDSIAEKRSVRARKHASPLEIYFQRPNREEFQKLQYTEYHAQYVVEAKAPKLNTKIVARDQRGRHIWKRTKRKVTRNDVLQPRAGEVFYFREILAHRAVRDFRDARTVEGKEYKTYAEAAAAAGIVLRKYPGESAFAAMVYYLDTPRNLRSMFVTLMLDDSIRAPRVYEKFKLDMWADFKGNSFERERQLLRELQSILDEGNNQRKTLDKFGLQKAVGRINEAAEQAVLFPPALSQQHVDLWEQSLRGNPEQWNAVTKILEAKEAPPDKRFFFLNGGAGRGKTEVLKYVLASVRARSGIAIAVATSNLAASLLPGGVSAHSRFGIPVNSDPILNCEVTESADACLS